MKIKKIKVTISTTKLTCSNERRLETVAVFICFIYTHKIIYRTIELKEWWENSYDDSPFFLS